MSAPQDHAGAIAIVGLAGRFPDAPDIASFWRNLKAGHESIRDLAPDEIDDDFDAATRASPTYVARRPILDGIENFDAAFFGMSAREAALTDPQQRVFLECAWSALEDAAIDAQRSTGPIGVFAGSALNTYFLRHVCGNEACAREFTSAFQVGHYQELLGGMQDFVASRVAYKLNLKGPAVTVQSACSTSLLAVAQACQSLQLYQCDAALAGGVSISVPQHRGYESLDGGMVSADGRVRPFDAAANGTVFGSGCGVVVLKRLEDATADGDRIYAVIRGIGVNNDGGDKVGFTAPSVAGQAEAIRMAHASAGVSSARISYVEAHGTATPLGDPIEFRALEMAFGDAAASQSVCLLGSVKANVGHLDAAAGVTGLVKTALQLHHSQIAPQINFNAANPAINLQRGHFRVSSSGQPWPRNASPRLAGVSAFGVGGTNVHLVVEEAPCAPIVAVGTPVDAAVILPLSGKTPEAVGLIAAALASTLRSDDAPLLRDVAATLARGRSVLPYRAAIAVRDPADAVRQLMAMANGTSASKIPTGTDVVFMFPGQGAQYPGMAASLYKSDVVFAQWIDRGLALAAPLLPGHDLRALLFDDVPDNDETRPHALRNTTLAQPALYIIEYALAQAWMARGVTASAFVGHSLGEFVAAALAGIFSYDDGLRLVIERGRLMQSLPAGGMVAVRATLAAVTRLLGDDVEVAAINAPNLVTVAGSAEALAAFTQRAETDQLAIRHLHTSHAFHSAMMQPAVAAMHTLVSAVTLRAPTKPIASCVTGTWLTADEACSPTYWARHCRVPVKFSDAISTALTKHPAALLEVGPGRTLSTFARQTSNSSDIRPIATLPEFNDRADDAYTLASAIAQLWAAGVPVVLPHAAGARPVSCRPIRSPRRVTGLTSLLVRNNTHPPRRTLKSSTRRLPLPPSKNPKI